MSDGKYSLLYKEKVAINSLFKCGVCFQKINKFSSLVVIASKNGTWFEMPPENPRFTKIN